MGNVKMKVDTMRAKIFSGGWKWEVYALCDAVWFALTIIKMEKEGLEKGEYTIHSDYDSQANYKAIRFACEDGKIHLIKGYDVVRRGALGEFRSRLSWEDRIFEAIYHLLSEEYEDAARAAYRKQEIAPSIVEAVAEAFV